MGTKVIVINRLKPDMDLLKLAGDLIRNNGLVIIPTETVYGIAANGSSEKAVEKLSLIKRRPDNKPFSLHICERDEVENYARDISAAAYRLIYKFWPGPLTLVFNSSRFVGTIGIRLPDDGVARQIIRFAGVPIVCPSANISGNIPPADCPSALKDLSDKVDMAVDAGPARLQVESSVVDVTENPVKILREGFIKKDEILGVAGKKQILFVCTGNSCRSVMAEWLLRKKLRQINKAGVEVLSAGVMMSEGVPASVETKDLLKQEGLDASSHRSRRLTRELLDTSELILVMEDHHEQRILQVEPHVKNRLFLLKEFAKLDGSSLNIPDPIGRDMEFYKYTFSVIKEAVDRVSALI